MSYPSMGGDALQVGSVAGIPVSFSPWFLLLVYVAYSFGGTPVGGAVLLMTLTLSILGHELGHGLVAKHYGLRPSIVIHGMGGYCQHAVERDRRRSLRVIAAGPGASFAMALGAQTLLEVLPTTAPPLLVDIVASMAQMNLLWFFFNALPVLPMDGGRLMQLLLGYRFPQLRADGLTYWTGMIVGLLAATYYWFRFQMLFAPLFLGVMAFQNSQQASRFTWAAVMRGRRNELPAARNGSGFDLPRPVAGLAALFVLIAVVNSVAPGPSAYWAWMLPSVVLDGSLWWTALTAPLSHSLSFWEPLGYTLVALFAFGPTVYRALGSAPRFFALYLGALLAGSAVTLALATPLGFAERVFFGAGAASAALLIAWARAAPQEPLLPKTTLLPAQLALGVLGFDVVLGVAGLAPWAWHAHLAGAAVGFLALRVGERGEGSPTPRTQDR